MDGAGSMYLDGGGEMGTSPATRGVGEGAAGGPLSSSDVNDSAKYLVGVLCVCVPKGNAEAHANQCGGATNADGEPRDAKSRHCRQVRYNTLPTLPCLCVCVCACACACT
jgi:hypothetical protein